MDATHYRAVQLFEKGVVDLLMDEEALPGSAALPRAEERRDQARVGGGGKVDVVQDHHRPVAAHLQDESLSGSPASTMHSASLTAQIEVVGAGVQTTAFPQASAGATASAAMVYGQFHGVITPTTPRGTR